jgi:hypothetical protein
MGNRRQARCTPLRVLLRAICVAGMTPSAYAADPVQSRYIPLELILGASWSGTETLTLPEGRFAQAGTNTTWEGPTTWKHRDTQETIKVYERRRKGVYQRMAVRKDAQAIGRVYDSRFDLACEGEGKFPLGFWKRGETRTFEAQCTNGEGKVLDDCCYVWSAGLDMVRGD